MTLGRRQRILTLALVVHTCAASAHAAPAPRLASGHLTVDDGLPENAEGVIWIGTVLTGA